MTFKELRERAKLSQPEAARLLKVEQATVSNWETGRCSPWSKLHRDIQRVYGCTMLELATAIEAGKRARQADA